MARYFSLKYAKILHKKYTNGRTALKAFGQEGEPLATLTVNIPGVSLNPGEVIIKDYSENEGVLKDLIEMGIVEKEYSRFPYGWVSPAVCKLVINPE